MQKTTPTSPQARCNSHLIAWLLLVLAACILTACMPYDMYLSWRELAYNARGVVPPSPLIPGDNQALTQNTWTLIEGSHRDSPLDTSQIAPVFLTMNVRGELTAFRAPCHLEVAWCCTVFQARIVAFSESQYYLYTGMPVPAVDCRPFWDAGEEAQRINFGRAMRGTWAYQLDDEQLMFTGPDARLIFGTDSDVIPQQDSPLNPVETGDAP